ncbi:hypothetical protein UFOVP5_2 [uncultured Caudovirales phage]|uniref:Uncharacterized protein n=1 Tax=uncultured Caudovirales phage TaxID=2100421 RepID=A0A6J5KGY1_9CAUD|nr:hypothetical protein UFOVP5_2 [uncultured Caudovirales phage]
MPYRVGSAVFSKGEISEELLARFDVDSYHTALKQARNVIVMKYGGVTKRPGTRFIAPVYKDQGVRLMPFQYSLEQTYVLEMGQAYMRVAALGGVVIEDKLTVEAITRGTTTIIKVSYHAYNVGDQVYFSGVVGADDINGKIVTVTEVIDANNFRIALDTTGYGVLTSDTGGTIRSSAPAAPPADPVVPPVATTPTKPDLGAWNNYGFGFR